MHRLWLWQHQGQVYTQSQVIYVQSLKDDYGFLFPSEYVKDQTLLPLNWWNWWSQTLPNEKVMNFTSNREGWTLQRSPNQKKLEILDTEGELPSTIVGGWGTPWMKNMRSRQIEDHFPQVQRSETTTTGQVAFWSQSFEKIKVPQVHHPSPLITCISIARFPGKRLNPMGKKTPLEIMEMQPKHAKTPQKKRPNLKPSQNGCFSDHKFSVSTQHVQFKKDSEFPVGGFSPFEKY